MKKLISIIVILGAVMVAFRAVHREQPSELAKDSENERFFQIRRYDLLLRLAYNAHHDHKVKT